MTRHTDGSEPRLDDALAALREDELKEKAAEAASARVLQRLRAGERSLAIHPNCGTNLVTSGMAAGLAGALAMSGASSRRERFERIPLAGMLATAALLLARPLGTRIQQRFTTSGDPGNLEVVEIRPSQRGNLKAFRVVTRG